MGPEGGVTGGIPRDAPGAGAEPKTEPIELEPAAPAEIIAAESAAPALGPASAAEAAASAVGRLTSPLYPHRSPTGSGVRLVGCGAASSVEVWRDRPARKAGAS